MKFVENLTIVNQTNDVLMVIAYQENAGITRLVLKIIFVMVVFALQLVRKDVPITMIAKIHNNVLTEDAPTFVALMRIVAQFLVFASKTNARHLQFVKRDMEILVQKD